MNIETVWLNITNQQRLWILREAGWRTNRGQPMRLAISASRKPWDSLSPAMQNVLTRRAAEGQIAA